MTYLLLAEKPSAAKSMASALGGMKGTYNGQDYEIIALYGHMLEYVEPHEMVDDEATQKAVQSWDPDNIPWNISEFNFKRRPQKTKNLKTGKISSKADGIAAVSRAAKGKSAIVIATDKDPSGEGQLIGWEVIHAIGWKGDVKRMYFIDESAPKLQAGFKAIEDLPNAFKDGEFLKAETRSRFDFASMQLVRLSTHAARSQGYNVKVVRQGRLKSVMTKLVADQLALVKAYKKQPYFEASFKDEAGNNFRRKFDPDTSDFRYPSIEDAKADAAKLQTSSVEIDKRTMKSTAPGKLLDLGGLASILGAKGFKSKEILATYQKMYEAKIVSYPRTEDKFISNEQFKEMLPLIDKIAGVVGADTSLLTHRTPRKTHVKDGGAHGANRPGLKVPASLDDLSKFGPSAKAIYQTLAKNFLAMFGEDYEYEAVSAFVKDYPDYKASITIPVKMGFKDIFDTDNESKDASDEESMDSKGFGQTATPTTFEGVNKKPPYPTHKWLEKQLSKYDVGTGATRVSTLSEVTNGQTALLKDTRGKLSLTQTGEIAAVLLDGSRIGDPSVTEQLFKAMRDVGDLKVPMDKVVHTITDIVKHDKIVFQKNAKKLKDAVGEPEGAPVKEKASGLFVPLNKEVRFSREFSGHRFTDDEVEQLLKGESISFKAKSKAGNDYTANGKLEVQEYKGRKFIGFKLDFKTADDYTIKTAPIPDAWSGYTFSDAEKEKLRNGEALDITATSKKTGKPFDVSVTFGVDDYQGRKSWKIIPEFKSSGKKSVDDYTIETAPMKDEFSGYKLSDEDKADLRRGGSILITPTSKKTGKKYNVNLTFGITEYQGRRYWGFIPSFD